MKPTVKKLLLITYLPGIVVAQQSISVGVREDSVNHHFNQPATKLDHFARFTNFNQGVISTPDGLVDGRISGVNVTPASGEPGANSTIIIRGAISLLAKSNPLFVIDGIPMEENTGLTFYSSLGNSSAKNALAFLNQEDIESVTVLKDASAAAIYGIRGGNGVISIKTKKDSETPFVFTSYVGVSHISKRFDLLSRPDYLQGVRNSNITAGADPNLVDQFISRPPINFGASTDWQDQVFRNGISNGYNLRWNQQSARSNFGISGGYENQNGVVQGTNLERLTGHTYFDHVSKDNRFRIQFNLYATKWRNAYAPITNNAGFQGSLLNAMIYYNPTAPVLISNGGLFDKADGSISPVALMQYVTDTDQTSRIISSVATTYNISKNLIAEVRYGFNGSSSSRKTFFDPRIPFSWSLGTTYLGVNYNNPVTENGRAVYQYLDNISNLFEATLDYVKYFNSFKLDVFSGFSYQEFRLENHADMGWGLSVPVTAPSDRFIKDIGNFTTRAIAYLPLSSSYSVRSGFAQSSAIFLNKYSISLAIRADASSKFADNQFAFFPAVNAKWMILNELFAKGRFTRVFEELNMRAGWGKAGNQEGVDAQAGSDVTTTYVPFGTSTPQTVFKQGNQRLKWESINSITLGMEWRTRKGRINGAFDYFNTKRSDIVAFIPVGGGFSASSFYYANISGLIESSGVDFSLCFSLLQTRKMKWDLGVNGMYLDTHIKDMDRTISSGRVDGGGLTGTFAQSFSNGQPLFAWYMQTFTGFDNNGISTYANGGNPQYQGSALPNFVGGVNTRLSFKAWTFTSLFTYATGFLVYNNTANANLISASIRSGRNVTYDVLSNGENPLNAAFVSSRFLEKGDFLRWANATIEYRIKLNLKTIKSLAVSLVGQNLALFTGYSGLDPQVNVDKTLNDTRSLGFDYAGYPRATTFSIHLKLGF
jgi:iron complex outermembrane receptor protein